jgi:hypothetical protein
MAPGASLRDRPALLARIIPSAGEAGLSAPARTRPHPSAPARTRDQSVLMNR